MGCIRNNLIPKYLHTIHCGCAFTFYDDSSLPSSLKYITLPFYSKLLNNLPNHIETLYINYSVVNKPAIEVINQYSVYNLPFSLKKLIINDKDNLSFIEKIPFGCVLEILPSSL